MKRRYFLIVFFLVALGVSMLIITEPFSEADPNMDKVEQKDEVVFSFKNLTLNTVDDILERAKEIDLPSYQEEAKEKIEQTKEEANNTINSLTSSFEEVTNGLAKQLISWLLSLLSPEEIKELLKSDFDIDICH